MTLAGSVILQRLRLAWQPSHIPHGELVEPRMTASAASRFTKPKPSPQTGALTPSARFTFPLWSAMRPVETDRSWGLITPRGRRCAAVKCTSRSYGRGGLRVCSGGNPKGEGALPRELSAPRSPEAKPRVTTFLARQGSAHGQLQFLAGFVRKEKAGHSSRFLFWSAVISPSGGNCRGCNSRRPSGST